MGGRRYLDLIEAGKSALEAGDARAAREAFEVAAAIRIGDPVSRGLLAEAGLREGDKVRAREVLREVLILRPGDVAVLSRLAKLELELGASEAASRTTKAAGAALKRKMRHRTAAFISAPARAVRALVGWRSGRWPDFKTAWLCREAAGALAERRLGDAGDLLTRAEERAPADAAVLHLKAKLLTAWDEPMHALNCIMRAREARPDDLSIRLTAIMTLVRADRGRQALQEFEELPAHAKETPEGKLAQAHVHRVNRRVTEAREILATLSESEADSGEVAYNLATIEAFRGNFTAAREGFHKAAELAPRWGQVYWTATVSRCMEKGDPLFRNARRLSEDAEASQLDRALAELSIGHSLIRAGEPGPGFAHLKKGNAMIETEYDPQEQEARIDSLIAAFPRSLYDDRQLPERGEGRIFIVGLPRSGSTLIEQVLASHPMVSTAGEAGELPRISARLEKEWGFPGTIATIDAAELDRCAQEYLSEVSSGSTAQTFVTDKNLHNVYNLGLIALLFPKARVVHCRRDLMDNGYSIYAHRFTSAYPYANDLRNIGHYFGLYNRLMAHWAKTLPVRIHEVLHARLVEEPEREIRRLLDAVSLPFNEACLRFHESERPVTTLSLAQVREGINRKSVGRWRQFAAELEPLREMADRLEATPGT